MKKIHYNKLIRDKIPEKIKKNGGDFKVKKLNSKEFEKELYKKISEETLGLSRAKNSKEAASELADILAVLDEVVKLKKIKQKDIEKAKKINFKIKGGFKKRLYLYWSSDTGYKSNERK